MRAWVGCVPSIGSDILAVYNAETAGQARGKLHRHVSDVFEGIAFTDCKIRRAPEFDGVAFVDGTSYSEAHHRRTEP